MFGLTACGGGGGGNNQMSGDFLSPEQRAAADSNAKITGMVSHVWVADDEESGARASSTVLSDKNNGHRYNLKNVAFESADKQFQTNPSLDFTMKLDIDENDKIVGIISIDDGEAPETFRRDKNDRFNIDSTHYATLNFEGIEFNKNRTNQEPMKYSDFGYVEMFEIDSSGNSKPQFIMPVIGGYQVKEKDINKVETDLVFKGIALGFVGEPCTEADNHLTLRDDNAELKFTKLTGDETLIANFANWYNVEATKYKNGKARIVFKKNTNMGQDFKFIVDGERKDEFATDVVDNNKDAHKVSVGFHYYGSSVKKTTEANGIVFYQHRQDPSGDPDDSDSWLPVGIGFGGTVMKK